MPTSKTWPGGATDTTPTAFSIPSAGELNWASLSDFLIALANSAQSSSFQKFAIRKATTTPVTVSASADCAIACQLAAPGAVAVNLPAGANKQVFFVSDATGDAATNNITISPSGADTIAGSATLVLNANREGVILIYNSSDTDWKVMGRLAGSSYLVNPMTTSQDIIVGGASGVPTRLGKGSNSTVMTVNGSGNLAYATIVNANVDAAAAIAFSKLASLTSAHILVGSSGNVATDVAVTGDITITNAGVTAIGSSKVTSAMIVDGTIVDGDISASAAITGSKLQAATSSNVGTVSYESTGSFSVTWQQNSTNHSTMTINWRRVGKTVTLDIDNFVASAISGGGALLSSAGVIPSAIRPTHELFVLVAVTNNSTVQTAPGLLDISSSGSMALYKDATQASFAGTGNCGSTYLTNVTYICS